MIRSLTLLMFCCLAVPAPARAESNDIRTRDWWRFSGNEYWNVFFPNGKGEKPATIEEVEEHRVLTIQPTDAPVTVGIYGGNRQEKVSLLRHLQRIELAASLEGGEPVEVVLTLRDAKGEKWRFAPRTLDGDIETIAWRFLEDVEEVYHGDPPNKEIDEALHLFNMRLTRPASRTPSRVVLRKATVTERVPATEALEFSLRTTASFPVIYEPDADQARLVLKNVGEASREGELVVAVRGRLGEPATRAYAFEIGPGQEQAWPMDLGVDTFGIKTLTYEMKVGGDQRAGSTDFAYLDPVGNDAGRDDPFQFAIGGAETEEEYAIMAAIGVEGIRMGSNWSHNERPPGKYNWEKVDREVEAFARHGFNMQYLVAYGHPKYVQEPWATQLKGKNFALQTAPPVTAEWQRYLRDLATRYDGKITHWEIWNEPDLEHYWKGSTDDYIELLRASHEALKSVNPSNVVMTGGFATTGNHGGHNLNPELQPRVIREAASYYDVHTHHQHGRFAGFADAIDGELAEWRAPLKEPKPLWFNETALSYKQAGGEWQQGEELVKKMSFAFARGAESYAWFVFGATGTGHISEFAMIHGPNRQPRPALVAYNELARQLRNTRFVQQVEPGTGRLILHFADEEAGDHVFVHWHEVKTTGRVPLTVRLPEGAAARRVDLMGNARPLEAVHGLVMVDVENEPSYLRITGAAAGIEVVPPVLRFEDPLVTVDGDGQGRVTATVSNPLTSAASIELAWSAGSQPPVTQQLELSAGERRELTHGFSLGADAAKAADLTVRAALAGGSLTQQIAAPIIATRRVASSSVEGREADFILTEQSSVVNYFMNDPGNLSKNWGGPDDLSAKVWLQTAEEGLRLVVEATDDVHQQSHPAGQLWRGDSIQIGLTTPDSGGFFEIGLARSDDGKPLRHVFQRPAGGQLQAREIAMETRRDGERTTYNVVFPWSMFGQERPRDLRFNIVVNDSDEGAREGLIRLGPGIDDAKNPARFQLLRLQH